MTPSQFRQRKRGGKDRGDVYVYVRFTQGNQREEIMTS